MCIVIVSTVHLSMQLLNTCCTKIFTRDVTRAIIIYTSSITIRSRWQKSETVIYIYIHWRLSQLSVE